MRKSIGAALEYGLPLPDSATSRYTRVFGSTTAA
jgi:hypothetical protein